MELFKPRKILLASLLFLFTASIAVASTSYAVDEENSCDIGVVTKDVFLSCLDLLGHTKESCRACADTCAAMCEDIGSRLCTVSHWSRDCTFRCLAWEIGDCR